MGRYRDIYLLCSLSLMLMMAHCSTPVPQVAPQDEPPKTSTPPDSIFEHFENLANTSSESYVSNPDSFLNNLHLQPQTVTQKEMYAYGLIFMAYGLREYGDHYSSIKYYEKALNFIQQQQVQDVDTHLYIFKPLAALYILIDDNQKSIDLLEQVLAELPADDHAERVGFANNLANAYLYNNDRTKAEKLLLETIEKPTSLLSKALLYNTLSSIYKQDNDLKNSIKFNQLALHEFRKHKLTADTLVWYASALAQYAEIHQDHTTAQQSLQLLNDHFPHTQSRSKASIHLIIADIQYRRGDSTHAIESYQNVVETFHLLGGKYSLDYKYTQALVGLARCHRLHSQADSALHYFQWAIENDFRTQQLITSKRNQLSNNIWNREIIEEMSVLIDQQLQRRAEDQDLIETLLWCIELSKGRLLVNEINRSENWDNASPEIKNAIQNIRNLYQKIAQNDQNSEIQRLQNQIQQTIIDFQLSERYFETFRYIPEKSVFLAKLNDREKDYFSYFIHHDETISLIGHVDQKYIYHKITDSLFLTTLQQFKDTYFGDTPNNYNLNPQQYQQQAYYFAQQLLPGIDAAANNIHLSLDGGLYGLPFDALYDKGFLVRKHNFAYLNSFILYDLLKTTPAEQTEITLLYRSQFPDPLPDLNFVNEEVENISKTFYSYKIPPQEQHDLTIVQQFASSRAIHIASHTLLDSTENPILYLQQPISTEQLRFYHIYSPMIFLSACNTGSGKSLPSEGMESIQRVFLGKGVPSVISTYWFANDEAMLRLTALFYRELQKSRRPVTALADAKRLFLADASVEQQNPWYWSNINYAGVNNEIGLRRTSNLPTHLLLGLLLIVVSAVTLIKYFKV